MQKVEYLYKAPNHTANLNEMRLKDKWCDVTIKVNEREIRAHKVILAANLKYFDAMLSNESFQESKEGVISMESVAEVDLEELVSYAYTGEILLTDSNALNLLELANYIGEDGIKEACIKFLEKNLRKEESCRAYKFADAIGSSALKNTAKATIIKNFEDCSKSTDYFNFDKESLMGILSDRKSQPAESWQIQFEGVLRWIMHDTKDRKNYVDELLSSVDMTKLETDYLMKYIYEIITSTKDEYCLTHDIILHYQTSKIQQSKQGQVLILVNADGDKFQFYNFMQSKWFFLQGIPDTAPNTYCYHSAVLSDKLYYTRQDGKLNYLQMFNPTTKQRTELQSSSSIGKSFTLCACSKFIYLCGGINMDNSISNKVFRYDPQTNSLATIIPMTIKRRYAAAIFYQQCLYVLGGHNGSSLDSVEKYDPATEKWTIVASMCQKRYGHAVTILDGILYACGGPGDSSVEAYDPSKNCWQQVASMNKSRHYLTVVAYEGKLLAIGGSEEKTVEVYDPSKNQWQIDHHMSSGLQMKHLGGGLISASCIAD